MKKIIKIGVLLILTLFGLAGCKKAKPEDLLNSLAENAEKMESFEVSIESELLSSTDTSELGVLEGGQAMRMRAEVNCSPLVLHGTGKSAFNQLGQEFLSDVEVYCMEEAGVFTRYANADDSIWVPETMEMGDDISYMLDGIEAYHEAFELEDVLKEINGEECFVLKGELEIEVIEQIIGIGKLVTGSGISSFVETGTGVKVPIELYIVKATQYPAKISIDYTEVLEEHSNTEELSYDKGFVEIEYSAFNKATDRIVIADDVVSEYTSIEGAQQMGALTEDWSDLNVMVNGTVLTLPCTFEDVENAGLVCFDEKQNVEKLVGAGVYGYVAFGIPESEDGYITLDYYNPQEEENMLKNCLLTEITHGTSYGIDKVGVILPGGIELDSTKEEVIAAYGEPAAVENGSHTWLVEEERGTRVLQISFEDDRVSWFGLSYNFARGKKL